MKRTEVLNKANQITTGERQEAYGTPEDNFTKIAALWSAYLDTLVTPEDVASMMILLKTARISSGQRVADNWVDIAGYAACGGEIQTKDDEKKVVLPEDMTWKE